MTADVSMTAVPSAMIVRIDPSLPAEIVMRHRPTQIASLLGRSVLLSMYGGSLPQNGARPLSAPASAVNSPNGSSAGAVEGRLPSASACAYEDFSQSRYVA